ncbi:MAG: rhodanese-like domain-containing protein [Campylobacterota bacterium]|nr:rhodanese-like domain-containing protein [Campylobacterota bacterium]
MKKIIGTIATTAIIATSVMALDVPANHTVDVAWLKANMADENLVIVDIRKKGYKEGHIKGAVEWKKADYREGRYYSKKTKKAIPGYIAAPLTIKRTMQKSGVNNDSAIVFYSGGTASKDYRDSALGVLTVQYHGFENAAILDGGLAAWKKDGGEVATKKTKVAKGNFSFEGRKFNQDIVATGEDIDEAVWTGSYQTVDANGKQEKTRNEAKGSHWYGTSKDPRRLKEGHLPGAKAMHTKVLSVEKDGVYYLGNKAHALAQFAKADVSADKPIIWYCNTGHLISGNWFVSKYVLGMKDADNRVYNASMADYTRWPKRKLLKK